MFGIERSESCLNYLFPSSDKTRPVTIDIAVKSCLYQKWKIGDLDDAALVAHFMHFIQ